MVMTSGNEIMRRSQKLHLFGGSQTGLAATALPLCSGVGFVALSAYVRPPCRVKAQRIDAVAVEADAHTAGM
jgi:hypothetical protein